jgi:hypothetical protein
VRTKNFDSEDVKDRLESLEQGSEEEFDTIPTLAPSYLEADLNISDEQGNILVQFADGHVRTKNFDSRSVNDNHVVHFSFDDGYYSIVSLFTGNYSSAWDCPFFYFLKSLHEQYGACFTIHLFVEVFPYINDSFAKELHGTYSWLKFSLHGHQDEDYGTLTTGGEDWAEMVSKVILMTGNPASIDRHTRLSIFRGTSDNIDAMVSQKFGLLAVSTTEQESRICYDLDALEQSYTFWNGTYYKMKNRIYYIRSYDRFDNVEFSEVRDGVLEYIVNRKFSEFFIHEYSVIDSNLNIVSKGERCLREFFKCISDNCFTINFFRYGFNY